MITQNTHASHAQSNISKFFILVILLFITISCGYDEEDTSPSQFKDVSASVNKDKKNKDKPNKPELWKVKIFVKETLKELQNKGITSSINEYYGKPLWKKPLYIESKYDQSLIVPMIDQNETKSIFIVAKNKDKTSYNIVERGNITVDYSKRSDNSVTVETIAQLFNSLDFALFGSEPKSLNKIIGRSGKDKNGTSRNINLNGNDPIKSEHYVVKTCEGQTTQYFEADGTDHGVMGEIECHYLVIWVDSGIGIIPTLAPDVDLDGGGSSGGGSGTTNIRNCSGKVSCFPLVKYPIGSDYESKYPKLTEYLKNQLPKIGDIPQLVSVMSYYTNMTAEEIKRQLKYGEGPTVKVEQLENPPYNETSDAYGVFNKEDPGSIILDIDFVNRLETSSWGTKEADVLSFFMGVTILHEFMHYGDWNYNNNYWNGSTTAEEGYAFEKYAYGQEVYSFQDAKKILLKKDN